MFNDVLIIIQNGGTICFKRKKINTTTKDIHTYSHNFHAQVSTNHPQDVFSNNQEFLVTFSNYGSYRTILWSFHQEETP